MKHFRWITPLLLALSVFLLQQLYFDFKDMKKDIESQKIDVAVMKSVLSKKLER